MATYYIKNGGSDSLDGLSDSNAWETITKVNGFSFAEGDTISFKCGSIWREQLTVPRNGSVGSYMIFNSYSTGDKPKIWGSNISDTWVAEGHTNIWQSEAVFSSNPNTISATIFFREVDDSINWGDYKVYTSDFANLVNEYDWCWDGSRVYVWCTNDPDTEYTEIECPQRGRCIALNSHSYIEVDGFHFAYSVTGVGDEGDPMSEHTGLIVGNCEIHHLGTKDGAGYGVHACYNTMLIEYNEIYECGRRSISVYNYNHTTLLISDIIVQNNYMHDSYHTSGIDTSAGNYVSTSLENLVYRNNITECNPDLDLSSNPPAGWYMRVENSGHITGVKIYNNIFIYPHDACINIDAGATNGITNLEIYNNTFFSFNIVTAPSEGKVFVSWTGVLGGYFRIKNNIFYTDVDSSSRITTHILFGDITYGYIDSDYNLYYSLNDPGDQRIAKQGAPEVIWDHNDLASIRSTWGWDTHSPNVADPLFVSSSDFHLQSDSPAKWTGVYLADVLTDVEGNPRHNPPSIGAYEFGSTDVVIGGKIHHWSTV